MRRLMRVGAGKADLWFVRKRILDQENNGMQSAWSVVVSILESVYGDSVHGVFALWVLH